METPKEKGWGGKAYFPETPGVLPAQSREKREGKWKSRGGEIT
jgi:hypothetical protein